MESVTPEVDPYSIDFEAPRNSTDGLSLLEYGDRRRASSAKLIGGGYSRWPAAKYGYPGLTHPGHSGSDDRVRSCPTVDSVQDSRRNSGPI